MASITLTRNKRDFVVIINMRVLWHIVRAVGLAVVGVGADQGLLDGQVADTLRAVFNAAPLLFGS